MFIEDYLCDDELYSFENPPHGFYPDEEYYEGVD